MITVIDCGEETVALILKLHDLTLDVNAENIDEDGDNDFQNRLSDLFPTKEKCVGHDTVMRLFVENRLDIFEGEGYFLGTEKELQDFFRRKIELVERFLKLESFK